MSQKEKEGAQCLIHASRGLSKTLGLMLWILSILERHSSALLFNNKADNCRNGAAGELVPFFSSFFGGAAVQELFFCCRSVSDNVRF